MAKRRANGEGSIFQRKDKEGNKLPLWAAQYTDNMGKKRTLYGKSQQIVRDKLKKAIRESDNGLSMEKSKITFAGWMAEWLEVFVKPTTRKSTHSSYYQLIYNHIIPAFPKVLLKDLRVDMLQRFFNEKQESGRLDGKEGGFSIGSLYNIKMIITSALIQAEQNGLITRNVAKQVKLPPRPKTEIRALTRDEQKKLEDIIEDYYNPLAFIFLLALYTGLRMAELIAVKLEDIDFDKKELHVRRIRREVRIPGTGKSEVVIGEPKTPKSKRTIPLNDRIIEPIKQFIEYRSAMVETMTIKQRLPNGDLWKDEGYLFISSIGTTPLPPAINRILDRLLKENGMQHIGIHALRHTFATRCLEEGMDVKTLADILGHSDASVTLNVYVHSMDEHKRNSIEKISNLFESKN